MDPDPAFCSTQAAATGGNRLPAVPEMPMELCQGAAIGELNMKCRDDPLDEKGIVHGFSLAPKT